MSYQTGTYQKGDDRRIARRTRDAVALVFEGYTLVESEAPESDSEVDETEQPEAVAPAPPSPKSVFGDLSN